MRPKKITPELKPKIAEALQTKSRKEVCAEFGLDYQMIAREFGNAWKRLPARPQEPQEAA